MDGYDYKGITMENHWTEVNRKSDKKKKMGLDWTHSTQRSRCNTETHIILEFTGI